MYNIVRKAHQNRRVVRMKEIEKGPGLILGVIENEITNGGYFYVGYYPHGGQVEKEYFFLKEAKARKITIWNKVKGIEGAATEGDIRFARGKFYQIKGIKLVELSEHEARVYLMKRYFTRPEDADEIEKVADSIKMLDW